MDNVCASVSLLLRKTKKAMVLRVLIVECKGRTSDNQVYKIITRLKITK